MTTRIIPSFSRRRFLAGVTTAAGAAILAACSSGTESPTPTTAGSAAPTANSAAPTTTSGSATTGTTPTAAPAMISSQAASPAAAGSASAGMTPNNFVPTAPANVPKGGAYTTTIVGTDAKSFHPYLTTDTVSQSYQSYQYGSGSYNGGSLIKFDDNTLDLIPDIASKVDVSPDKKTYTFTLRDRNWSDGKPITTDDYVWTFQQVSKPENKYPYLDNLKVIASYVAKDAKTLVVTLTDATATGLSDADAVGPLPRHIWEKYDWSDPAKNPEINNPTVGCGPFLLKEWQRDDHATFVANDQYYLGRPNIDSRTVRVFGNQTLAYQALKSGQVDSSGFQPSDYKEAKTLPNINVYEWYAANGNWDYIGFNLRRDPLKDANVRKAIAYATDRQGIIDSVLYGLARPTYSAIPPSSWAYNPNVEHYDFNVSKAQDLFKQAGYTFANKKLTKDGQQLTLKALYPTGSPVSEGIATVTQQQLGDLGINVTPQALEFQALLNTVQSPPFDWDLFIGAWSSTAEPYYSYQIWAESSIPQLNSGAYVNKQVEMLFDQSDVEFDRDKRKAIFGQIQQLITNDEPYVFLFESKAYVGINKRIGGISVGPFGTYDVHKWYITGK